MGYILKLAAILTLITGIAAGSLALVNMKTRPIIEENRRIEEANARADVMPEGEWVFVLHDSASALPYYKVYADSSQTSLVGYIFTAAGRGYSSTIKTVTSLDTSFNIMGIKIIFQQETPGLGAKCTEVSYGENDPWFQRQYFQSIREKEGKAPLNALMVAVDKDGGEIQSITGATITGRVVTNSIKEYAQSLKDKIGDDK